MSNLRVKYGAPAIRNPSGPPHHAPRLRRKMQNSGKMKNIAICAEEGAKKVQKMQNSTTGAEDSAKKVQKDTKFCQLS